MCPAHPEILPFCDFTKSVLLDWGQTDAMSLNSLTSRQQATTRGCRSPAAAAANVPRPAVAPMVNRAAALVSSSSSSLQQQQVAPTHRRQQQPARLVACAAAAAEKGAWGADAAECLHCVCMLLPQPHGSSGWPRYASASLASAHLAGQQHGWQTASAFQIWKPHNTQSNGVSLFTEAALQTAAETSSLFPPPPPHTHCLPPAPLPHPPPHTHSSLPSAVEQLTVQPIKTIAGTVKLPGSKSLSNRILLLAALAEGTTVVRNLLVRRGGGGECWGDRGGVFGGAVVEGGLGCAVVGDSNIWLMHQQLAAAAAADTHLHTHSNTPKG